MNEFEKKLQQEKLRTIPGEWRDQILRATRMAIPEKRSFLSAFNDHVTALLWPHPKAWAGIAAVWILIFAANLATNGDTSRLARTAQGPSAEYWRGLREQEQFLTQLMDPKPQLAPADRPKLAPPRPRSEYILNIATA
ncbi:MAG: hypothetical protein JWM68_3412 [Verrucomicrobiales bacterium]|nr:hypothetical protein [Verrucomicrobiales bacterium]